MYEGPRDLTSPLGAFRRKKALHDSHDTASKLYPMARSPHTPHTFSTPPGPSPGDVIESARDSSAISPDTDVGDENRPPAKPLAAAVHAVCRSTSSWVAAATGNGRMDGSRRTDVPEQVRQVATFPVVQLQSFVLVSCKHRTLRESWTNIYEKPQNYIPEREANKLWS